MNSDGYITRTFVVNYLYRIYTVARVSRYFYYIIHRVVMKNVLALRVC